MKKTKGKKKQVIQGPKTLQMAVDIVVFTIINNQLSILLIRRGFNPFKNSWALPGGFINKRESLQKAAERELQEETGLYDIYLEQLYTFGEPYRDPRGRIISISYFALIKESSGLMPNTDAVDAQWFNITKLPRLAFDHKYIISYALKRLRWKLEYTNIVSNLLATNFTLSELQNVYEIILCKKLDKRNFRKKILSLNLVKPTNKKKQEVAYRPPQLWRFTTTKNVILIKRELVF